MSILVTGSSGFVGHAVVMEALRQGKEVHCLTRTFTPRNRLYRQRSDLHIHQASLNDHERIAEIIQNVAPSNVVHLAWEGTSPKTRNDNSLQFSNNIQDTIHLYQCTRTIKCRTFFALGSQSEYGQYTDKVDERHVAVPTTAYGLAKYTTLCALQALERSHASKIVTWGRLFSTFGARDNPGSFVRFIVDKLVAGEDVDLTEGKQFWDFLHVSDVARYILALCDTTEACGIVNIGSGNPISIRSFVEKLHGKLISSSRLNFGAIPYAPDQLMHMEADTEKLNHIVKSVRPMSMDEGLDSLVSQIMGQRPN